MPPGEITVNCPGCGSVSRLPVSAIRRDNSYCSKCGKRLALEGASVTPADPNAPATAAPKRRPYRPAKRR